MVPLVSLDSSQRAQGASVAQGSMDSGKSVDFRSPFHGCVSSMLQTAVDSCGKVACLQELGLTVDAMLLCRRIQKPYPEGLSNGHNVMISLNADMYLSRV